MHILSVEVSLPGPLRPQEELVEELAKAWGEKVTDRERTLLERLAKSAGVQSKHLAMNPSEYTEKRTFTERNRMFQQVGMNLAQKSISRACEKSGLALKELDAIFFTTVTGLSVPSLDARLVNALNLREDIKRIPMFGLGCVAGAAGLGRVHDYLKAYPQQAVVLLSVELCSLTLQLDDVSPVSIVAAALFGDGCAAVLCVGEDHRLAKNGRIQTLRSKSRMYPNSEHIMGWDIGGHGFKIMLDPGVPQIVETYFAEDVRNFLVESKLQINQIQTWVSHPGGPKVLKAIESTLALPTGALDISWTQLARLGNLSSASVLSILNETLDLTPKSLKSGNVVLMAMGPGFCSELLLGQWL